MDVVVPKLEWQIRCSKAYKQRDEILDFAKGSAQKIGASIDEILSSGIMAAAA
jgi:hypothetical protein